MNFRMLRLSAGGTAIVALTLLFALGCGGGGRSNKITVTGTVTYDGKPVEAGTIQFVLSETGIKGGDNATATIVNGKFSSSSVTPGKNTVVVTGGGKQAPVAATKGGYGDRPQMPDMRNPKAGVAAMKKGKAEDDSIPDNAPGNRQEFDIGGKDGTNLDIKIMKK
jgi:hypothetical protein